MRPIQDLFPLLGPHNTRITSPADTRYNCIAWAAEDEARWWWPNGYFWPHGARQSETLVAFEEAFMTLGYEHCPDGSLDEHFVKVAIFVDASGTPTHAARQLPNGRWSSKLGRSIDVEHPLREMEGATYGTVARYMRKRI